MCIDSAGWVSSAAVTDDGITVSFGSPQNISVHLSEAFMMRAYALMMENIQRSTGSVHSEVKP